MDSLKEEEFALELAASCQTHEAWLSVIRFGMGTLMGNQPLLIELIVREAQKELRVKNISGHQISDEARFIFFELGLRMVLA